METVVQAASGLTVGEMIAFTGHAFEVMLLAYLVGDKLTGE